MTYSTVFWLEVVVAIAVGAGAISLFRKRRACKAEKRRADLNVPVGAELAQSLALFLKDGLIVCYRHRDGCGVGLRYADGKFVCGLASDGELPSPAEFQQWGWEDPERMEFSSDDEFITWLSVQTDVAFAKGGDSQRLTRSRLARAAQFCMTYDRAQWPSYAG